VVLGGLYGAGIGAVGFGISAALSIAEVAVESGWGVLIAFVDLLVAGIAGAIIGGSIAAIRLEQGKGALLGTAIGFLIACYFFPNVADLGSKELFQAALVIATGALIGWLTAFRLHTPW
jgi:hypothetical protein